jgi:hypothetical protein
VINLKEEIFLFSILLIDWGLAPTVKNRKHILEDKIKKNGNVSNTIK